MSNSSTISYFRNPFLRIIPLQPLFNKFNNYQSKYTYYNPSQIKTAYNVVTPTIASGHRNTIITVIVAYHYPNLQQDFNTFCTTFGLPQKNTRNSKSKQ
jgi:subtilase family serine protease